MFVGLVIVTVSPVPPLDWERFTVAHLTEETLRFPEESFAQTFPQYVVWFVKLVEL